MMASLSLTGALATEPKDGRDAGGETFSARRVPADGRCVWYVPGWLRTASAQEGTLASLSNSFPKAEVSFWGWNGDKIVWPQAVESADQEAWRLAFQLATMPEDRRRRLTLVGHSLGGRIVARALARLAEQKLAVDRAYLLAAALPNDDPDLARMGLGARRPIMAVCNPDDVTLRYVYAMMGGERAQAFGAAGTVEPVTNVVECVVPSNATVEVKIDALWAKSQFLKDVANHHALFYLECLGGIERGERPADRVLVPQDLVTVEHTVMDAGVWWDVLDTAKGWKLERHKLTHHCRILSNERRCVAWGGESEMKAAFEKVKRQLMPPL